MSNSPFFCVTSDISSNKVRHHQRLLRFLSVSVCAAVSSPYGSLSGEQCELQCSFSSSSPQTVPAMFSASPHTVTLSRTLFLKTLQPCPSCYFFLTLSFWSNKAKNTSVTIFLPESYTCDSTG